eukprot:1301628-Pyramimonas_sp.AAC.1
MRSAVRPPSRLRVICDMHTRSVGSGNAAILIIELDHAMRLACEAVGDQRSELGLAVGLNNQGPVGGDVALGVEAETLDLHEALFAET